MNNKAFTLIELTAVIIVLATMFLVIFPNFFRTARIKETEKFDKMIEDLCIAGESYIYSNIDVYDELNVSNSEIIISIQTLMNEGVVKKNTINPKTKVSVETDELIYKVLPDKTLSCEYNDK